MIRNKTVSPTLYTRILSGTLVNSSLFRVNKYSVFFSSKKNFIFKNADYLNFCSGFCHTSEITLVNWISLRKKEMTITENDVKLSIL